MTPGPHRPSSKRPARWPTPILFGGLLLTTLVFSAAVAAQPPPSSRCGTLAQIDPPSLQIHAGPSEEEIDRASRLDIGLGHRSRPGDFPHPDDGVSVLPDVDPSCDPLHVQAALVWRDTYHPGDLMTVDLVLGARRALVAVDFSGIDDGYRAGAEQVRELGDGHYRVAYRISPDNQRPSGDYHLPIYTAAPEDSRVAAPGNADRIAESFVEVGYRVGRRQPRLEVLDARLAPGPAPRRPRGPIEITKVRFLGKGLDSTAKRAMSSAEARRTTGSATPKAPRRVPESLRHRNRLTVEMTVPRDRYPRDLELEIWQPGIDEHWQLPVAVPRSSCRKGFCFLRATVEVGSNGAGLTRQPNETDFDLVLRAVADGGASGPAQVPDLPLVGPAFEPTHRVSGTVRFQYSHRYADTAGSGDRDDWPQYADVASTIYQKSVRNAVVVLEDECGHYIEGATDSSGYYSFEWAPFDCGIARVTAWALVESGVRKAGVGFWKHGPVDSYDELTANTSDYLAHSWGTSFWASAAELDADPGGAVVDVTVPQNTAAARGFYILDNVLTGQDYFRDIGGVCCLPKLNVVYSPGLKPEDAGDDWDGGYAVYMPSKHPGMIVIPAEPEFGWNRFAHLHEVAHYFQKHYLRNMNYGRIGEPLANAHATAIMGNEWFDKQSEFESIDVQPNFKDGEFRGASWSFCDGCDELDYSYGWTQRVLWDMVDGHANSEPEPVTVWYPDGAASTQSFGQFDLDNGGGGHGKSTDADDHQLNDVLVNYVGGGENGTQSPDYQDRGLLGVDLVDVIDGMLCRGKISEDAVEALVNDAMEFGYDFGGPGNC